MRNGSAMGATRPASGRGAARAALTLLALEAKQRVAQGPSGLLSQPALLAFIVDPAGGDRDFAISTVARHVGAPVHRVDMSEIEQADEARDNFARLFFAAERAGVLLYFDPADALFESPAPEGGAPGRRFDPQFLPRCLDSFGGVVIAAVRRRDTVPDELLQRARYVIDFGTAPPPVQLPLRAGSGS